MQTWHEVQGGNAALRHEEAGKSGVCLPVSCFFQPVLKNVKEFCLSAPPGMKTKHFTQPWKVQPSSGGLGHVPPSPPMKRFPGQVCAPPALCVLRPSSLPAENSQLILNSLWI